MSMAVGLAHFKAIGLPLVGSGDGVPVRGEAGRDPLLDLPAPEVWREAPLLAPAGEVGGAQDACLEGVLADRPELDSAHQGEAREEEHGGHEEGDGVAAVQARMEAVARSVGFSSARLLAVEPGYYDKPLEWRCERLGANSVDELCKSIVVENTKLGAESAPGRIRCLLVVVQYIAKLNKEKLMMVLRDMETELGFPALGRKQYNMRLLEGEACAQLTGCEHNAVAPIGLANPMRIVLSHHIAALPSGHFWCGGGHVDLKLRLDVGEAMSALGARAADITA